MRKPLFLAWLVLCAALQVDCGARPDLLDDPLASGAAGSGAGGSTGSGTANGSSSAGHGSTSASGSNATAASSSSSGGGTTSSSVSGSGPGATSSSTAASSSAASSSASGGMICPGFGNACSDCVAVSCPATYCACYNDPECLAIFLCTDGCGPDQACQQACLTAHPSGISEAYLVIDCAGSLCSVACPKSKPVDPCSKCLFEDCAPAMNACLAEPECLALYNCLKACGNINLACQQACYQAHGAGVPTLQAVLQCSDTTCKPSCN